VLSSDAAVRPAAAVPALVRPVGATVSVGAVARPEPVLAAVLAVLLLLLLGTGAAAAAARRGSPFGSHAA
jgi:hypothetical protein